MIRCIAVDDEPWALALVTDYIKKLPFLDLIFETDSSIEALQFLQENPADLLFLDIQMPDLTGMQLMKIMSNKIPVILTTAYSEYAIEGYEHHVIDYLLKPISFDRFYKAAEKARMIFDKPAAEQKPLSIPPATQQNTGTPDDFIFIKTDSKMVRVPYNEILYIEGLKDYIAIVTTKEKLITLQNLRTMEELLPGKAFIRIHKSYIVAINKIDSIERSRIFIGHEVIPIGDTFREFFLQRISGN
ncbi:MAG: LytTR family DNA-binding domain-containing protein [Chitinophagaceae bacterium]